VRETGLFCLLAFMLSAVTADAQTYRLYRANLHAHTAYSDGGESIGSYPSEANPGTAAQQARANGLDAFACTDHGEYLSQSVWEDTKTKLTQQTVPGTFVALWGFEWTATADTGAPTLALGFGHLNVYGSDLRTGKTSWPPSANPPPLSDAEKTPYVCRFAVNGGWTMENSLYRWLVDNGQAQTLGGTIVAQFNHPSLYPKSSLANPAMTSNPYTPTTPEWWRKLEWVAEADPFITLMEMSSRTIYNPPYQGADYNESHFQLALDNGWHVSPTNNEDNHSNNYGALKTSAGIYTTTGIWAEPTTGLTANQAQGKILAALAARRTFSAEDKVTKRSDGLSLKWTFDTPSGEKWMGNRTMSAADVSGSRCRLEVSRAAGLNLSSVQVITNRGVVALNLPVSGAGVTIAGNTATWNFGLAPETPGAQAKAFNAIAPANPTYSTPPLPTAAGAAPLTVGFDASSSGRIERYYYVRVRLTDGTTSISAPIWFARATRVPTSFVWDYGDGTGWTQTVSGALEPGVAGRAQHIYATNGTYYPRVTVFYADGGSETTATIVRVGDTTLPPLYGDATGDGQVNGEDISLLLRMASGMASSKDRLTLSDVYLPADNPVHPGTPGDGKVTLIDALRAARFLSGKEPVWP